MPPYNTLAKRYIPTYRWYIIAALATVTATALGATSLGISLFHVNQSTTHVRLDNDTELTCSAGLNLTDCPLVRTVNHIPPFQQDFTLIGGPGIGVIGGMNSLTIYANFMIEVPEEFQVGFTGGMMFFEKKNQTGNLFWASPANGTTGKPMFRAILEDDLPSIPVGLITGTLPLANGGTGSNTSFSGSNILLSAADGQSIVEGNLIGGPGVDVSLNGSSYTISSVSVVAVDLVVPEDIFITTSPPVTYMGSLSFNLTNQTANYVWAAPDGSSGRPAFRLLQPADIPLLNASSHLVGVLSVANGGTGFSGPLVGGKLMFSTPTTITEGSIVAGPGIGVNINGTELTIDNLGLLTATLAVPGDIFESSNTTDGMLSFTVRSQSQNTFWASPVNGTGVPSFREIQPSDLPLINATSIIGVLAPVNGGTGSSASLAGNRVIVSTPSGTMVESGILNDGMLMIGRSGDSPIPGNVVAPLGNIQVTKLPGEIQLRLANTVNLVGLSVAGTTLLGNSTSCSAPLAASCYDISNQGCPAGPLSGNCVPDDITIDTITVTHLTVLNTTDLGTVVNQEHLNVTNFITDHLTLNSDMMCPGNASISQDCFDISGKQCSSGNPIDQSCLPASLVVTDLTVTNNLTVNTVTCSGGIFSDECTPKRIKTIAGIEANSSSLDFDLQAGTGISISPVPNGVSIVNSGLLSLALAVPTDLFSVTGSPATGAGSLALTTNNQAAGTFWAGPETGSPDTPSFRAILVSDLPALGANEIYYGVSGATNLTGTGTVTISYAAGTLTVEGTGVSSVGISVPGSILSVSNSPITSSGTIALDLVSQTMNTVFAGPDGVNGNPVFRALELSDLPARPVDEVFVGTGVGVDTAPLVGGTGISVSGLTISNTGVTSVGLALPASIFSVSGSPVTTTGTLSGSLVVQSERRFFAGPTDGNPDAVPVFRTMEVSDLPAIAEGSVLIGGPSSLGPAAFVNGSGIEILTDSSTITISTTALQSVALSVPSELIVTNSPLTADGTIAISKATQARNTLWAGPVTGGAATPSFRGLEIEDFDSVGLAEGNLIMGGPSGVPIIGNLIAGSNVNITNEMGGGIRISASINETAFGTVMSVGLAAPASLFSVSGSPVTDMGTLTLNLATQAAREVFMGPVSGGAATPSFRLLQVSDLPTLATNNIFIGVAGATATRTLTAGNGISITTDATTTTIASTVSVGLSLPGSIFSVTGSPVTSSGTLSATLHSQMPNFFFAGPSSGGSAAPTFRSIALSDLPSLGNGQLYIGQGGTPVAAGLAAGMGISINTGPGTITISATGGMSDFSNGGDTAGADRTLGNNDNFALGFETNGQERVSIAAGGNVAIGAGGFDTDFRLTVNHLGAGGQNGLSIRAGEVGGDIALRVTDQDESFPLLDIDAQGRATFGKTYDQTITDNGVAYGIDLQHSGTDVEDFNTQNGRYRIAGNVVMYGTHYQFASSEGTSSTSSTSFQQKLRLTTPSIPAGSYRIGFYYEWRCDSISQSFEGRVQVDNSITIHSAHIEAKEDDSDESIPESGFTVLSLGTGTHTIDIDYRRENSGSPTVFIKAARLEIWRVS